jgi:hypothetical protein
MLFRISTFLQCQGKGSFLANKSSLVILLNIQLNREIQIDYNYPIKHNYF